MKEEFLTANDTIKKITNSFYTITPLNILAILIGEKYTGKKTLIKSIFPNYLF